MVALPREIREAAVDHVLHDGGVWLVIGNGVWIFDDDDARDRIGGANRIIGGPRWQGRKQMTVTKNAAMPELKYRARVANRSGSTLASAIGQSALLQIWRHWFCAFLDTSGRG